MAFIEKLNGEIQVRIFDQMDHEFKLAGLLNSPSTAENDKKIREHREIIAILKAEIVRIEKDRDSIQPRRTRLILEKLPPGLS